MFNQIILETRMKAQVIFNCLLKFERDNKIIFRDNWIAIKNFAKHQKITKGNVLKGVENGLKEAPEELLKWVKSDKPVSLSKTLEDSLKDLNYIDLDLNIDLDIDSNLDLNYDLSSSEKDETEPPCNYHELKRKGIIKQGSKEYMWCFGSTNYEGVCTHKCPKNKDICMDWKKKHTKEVDAHFKKEADLIKKPITNWTNFRKSERYHQKWFFMLNYQITHNDSWLNSAVKQYRNTGEVKV
jgi:hypothetical protein